MFENPDPFSVFFSSAINKAQSERPRGVPYIVAAPARPLRGAPPARRAEPYIVAAPARPLRGRAGAAPRRAARRSAAGGA